MNLFFENLFHLALSIALMFNNPFFSLAQEQKTLPHFKFFNQQQGFHGDKVRAMIQDQKGFIWIGTNEGVFIFNGETFEQVKSLDPKANEIVGSIIQKMVLDSKGNIWIGSNKGLVVYYNQSQKFKYIPLQYTKQYITGIVETPDHSMWVSSDLGVYKINSNTLVVSVPFTTQSIPTMSHVVLCNQQLYIVSVQKIYSIDYKTRKINSIHTYNNKAVTSENISTSIISDQNNIVWIGKYNGMIYSFYSKEKKIDSIDTKKETSNNSAIINQLYYDTRNNNLILCIDESGVYELKNRRLNPYFKSYQSLPTKKITGILIDKENITWISMEKNGLAVSNPKLNFFSNYTIAELAQSNIISAVCKDTKGNLWIGTDGGGLILKNKTNRLFLHDPKNSKSISNDAILSITEDKKGNIWIGSFRGGLSLYHPTTQSFTNYTTTNSLIAGNDVRKITEDANGNLWLVIHGKGISCFNPNTQTFKNYTSENSLWTYDLIIDKENRKWIASNEGVSVINIQQELEHIPSTQLGLDIHALCEDENNNIWIGTVKGLYYLKKQQRTLKQIPKQSILNQLSITWIKQVKEGYLLIGTSKGMFLLNTRSYETQFYNRDNGLPSDELIVNAVFKDSYKKIYVGTSNGYFIFNYDSLPVFTLNKAPIIQYIFINEQQHALSDNLTVPYDKNNLTIHLCYPYYSINRTDFGYEYKIEGLDKAWKLSNISQLNFRALPYGKYIITIRSINKSNRSQHSPETVLKIHITPPIWETIWFKITATLIAIICIYLYYRLKTRQILAQNKILESKIEERTSLLNRQKELLLVKQEELESSNQTKEKLFSIIAHDLRAPFSSILGLTHLLKDRFNKIDATEYMRYLDVMQNSSEQAFQLLDNLLEWAKTHMHNITYNPEWHSIYSISNDVLQNFKNRSIEKNIDLKIEGDKKLYLYTDAEILKTIIRNLINNAIKYTHNDGEIIICYKVISSELISLSIKDNGKGIHADKIKELFYTQQMAESVQGTSGEKGTGIGLWICKELLPIIETTWEVKSEINKGTEILLHIKCLHDIRNEITTDDLEPHLLKEESDSTISYPSLKNKTILLVEDDLAILETLKLTLSPYFQLQSVNNGLEALSFLDKNEVDLIVSDVMMPEMDGITFAIHCKNNDLTSAIPILLLSSQKEELTIIKGLQTGVDDYLIKPIAKDILLLKIHHILSQRDLLKKKFTLSNQELLNEISTHSVDNKFIEKMLQIIDAQLADERFGVEELSKELGLHRSSLAKKTTQLLKITPLELIKTQRLKKSAQLLIASGLNVSEIAYEVGFTDPKYFSKSFKAYYGMSPSEYATFNKK